MNESEVQNTEGMISSDEEELTAATVLQEIEKAWLNEKFAPEILPHQSDLVDCMLQQIAHMEDNMKKLKKGDLRFVVHKMEIDRIRFVITSYLRTRLEKIEEYTVSILTNETKRSLEESFLTSGERKFAQDYLTSVESLFKSVALDHMPSHFREFEVRRLVKTPNLYSHVFLKVNKSVDGITEPGSLAEEINLEAGSQHIIKYKLIAHLIREGAVQLI